MLCEVKRREKENTSLPRNVLKTTKKKNFLKIVQLSFLVFFIGLVSPLIQYEFRNNN